MIGVSKVALENIQFMINDAHKSQLVVELLLNGSENFLGFC